MRSKFHLVLPALWIAVLPLSLSSSTAVQEPAFSTATYRVSNWRTEALAHLEITEAKLDANPIRCVLLNNYWCLKGVGPGGTVGWEGGLGVDDDGHAAFRSGTHAARAAARNLRTAYVRRGRKSAWQIMSVYAPPDDCVGGDRNRLSNGSCRYGKNPTGTYAARVARGITDDIHGDLRLFAPDGTATAGLAVLLANIAAFEIGGVHVKEATIRQGICMENACIPPGD
jgi:hypothetical protein